MDHCIQTLLAAGDEAEIILVDDGSTDNTPSIADRYQEQYPEIVRVIHQPNGGHGEGVNQGMRNAQGLYYKVVDSDDWLDVVALKRVMDLLRSFVEQGQELDLLICNYVYEHVADHTRKVIRYHHVFPENQIFGWNEMGHWKASQYLLMHSVIYRTQLLRDSGMVLPKHTFYVDNIFVYEPLPTVRNMYYMDVDLYRYFIGRSDQSVNEQVMVTRVDQQLRVTYHMLRSHDLKQVKVKYPKLGRYMFNYLSMMVAISSILLTIDGSPEALGKKTQLWENLRKFDSGLYHKMKYRSVSSVTNFPGYQGRKLSVKLYRLARRIYKFN
jgi:glycosyltransferase involved in cell wall biosynthesis